ncbi:hypothetical protein IT411_02800 [Candidatus Peregrinibacteria bacterium]|nr:hypothetical protein [Candidatus Peregrinibacteria bacterium]
MVIFDESIIKAPLAEQIFTSGTSGKFTGEIIETEQNPNYQFILKLHQYEIISQAETENHSTFILIAVIFLGVAAYLIYRNRKWIISQSAKFLSPS